MDATHFLQKQRFGATIAVAVVFVSQGAFWAGTTNNSGAIFLLSFLCVAFMVWLSRLCLFGEIVAADLMDQLPAYDKFLILLSHISLILIGFLTYVFLRKLGVLRIFAAIIPIFITAISYAIHYGLSVNLLRSEGFSLKWFSSPGRFAVLLFIYGFLLYMLIRFGMAMSMKGDLP